MGTTWGWGISASRDVITQDIGSPNELLFVPVVGLIIFHDGIIPIDTETQGVPTAANDIGADAVHEMRKHTDRLTGGDRYAIM
jgi:hypothetical protein